ncbi:uncharacterized protein TNCV_1274751 [Trichonephila clavipes]|nr:uncharacterized protein TNCV_1274751 [Trichonephila clavipes]
MPRERAFHHFIIVSFPRQDKSSKGNVCAIQHNFMLLTVSYTRAFGDGPRNHGQVTWTTPELAPPLLTTTPHQREDVSALDRFNVHRCPTRRVFSGMIPVTKQATVRYLYHSATAATPRRLKERDIEKLDSFLMIPMLMKTARQRTIV